MTSEWVFVIRNKFGVPIFSNREQARQKEVIRIAHVYSQYELKSIKLITL